MLLKELSPGTKGTIVGYDKKAPEYREVRPGHFVACREQHLRWCAWLRWAIRLRFAFAAALSAFERTKPPLWKCAWIELGIAK